MIVVIDYDTGNLRSVENLLSRMGAEYCISSNAQEITSASRVILPGVGEASSAMEKLRQRGLEGVIRSLTQPVLGICIGMQLMCRGSQEGNTECLGIFETTVKRFAPIDGLKVPHMGWNTINNLDSALLSGIAENSYIYYVHSYAPQLCHHTIATTKYGVEFSAALGNGNFFGTQFHPEKSGELGERIMNNFLRL